jgi:hypothetical protein
MRCPVVLVAILMAVVGTAVADEPLVTDRTTVTASAVTVPRDTQQLEGDATWVDGCGDRCGWVWASATLALALGDRLAGFAEVYAYEYEQPGGPDVHVAEVGVTYLLTPRLHLDARIGRRLGSPGPDLVAGAGAAWRIEG